MRLTRKELFAFENVSKAIVANRKHVAVRSGKRVNLKSFGADATIDYTDERGWITFAEAHILFSSKGAQYAFGETEQALTQSK